MGLRLITERLAPLGLFFALCIIPFAQCTGSQIDSGQQTLHLSLQQTIEHALRFNRNLISSQFGMINRQLSVASAKSDFDIKVKPLSQAGTSDEGDQLTVGLGISKAFDIGIKASVAPEIGLVDNEFKGEIAAFLEIPLFRGFGKNFNLEGVNQSRFSLRTAERNYYLARVNTVVDTVTAVYNIIKQESLVDLYESQVDKLDRHLQDAILRKKVGLATSLDVFRAKIRLADAHDSLNLSREALENAIDRLKIILSIPQEQPLKVTAPLEVEPVNVEQKKALEIALQNRIEIKQAEDALGDRRRNSSIAKEKLLPGISLVAGYITPQSSVLFGDVFSISDSRWTVTLAGKTDWARSTEKLAFQQSLNDIRSAQININARREDIKREVRQQLDSLQKAKKRIHIRQEQIHQTEGKLALAEVKFRYNMADNFDVIEANRELQQSKVDLLSVKIEYIVGIYRLRRTLGTLLKQ